MAENIVDGIVANQATTAEDVKKSENATEVPAFLHIADRFITLANEQVQQNDMSTASSGFFYANARFTAFLIASQCGSVEALEAEKAAAIEYFVNQFAQALTSNIADYEKNFAQYFTK